RERRYRDVLTAPGDTCPADRDNEPGIVRYREAFAVNEFVLEKDNGVWIADSGLQQALVVGAGVRRNDLEAGNMRIPARIALRMLRGDAGGDAVGSAEDDRAAHLPARHVAGLAGGVDDLVDRLHRKVESHELDDRPQAGKTSADPEAGESL